MALKETPDELINRVQLCTLHHFVLFFQYLITDDKSYFAFVQNLGVQPKGLV